MAAPNRMNRRGRRGAMINMDGNSDDPNYRYKMESVLIKSEGKNTGKNTIFINIMSIAESIIGTMMNSEDDPRDQPSSKQIVTKTMQHIVGFLRKEIGGNVRFNKSRNVVIISGEHEVSKLQRLIFQYIQRYTMCPQCDKPELLPVVLPPVSCRACGHSVKSQDKGRRKKRDKKEKHKKERVRGKGKRKKMKNGKKRKNRDSQSEESEVATEQKSEDEGASCDAFDPSHALQQQLSTDPIFALNHYLKKDGDVSNEEIMEKIKVLSLAHSLDRQQQIKMVVHCLAHFNDEDHEVLLESIRKYKTIFVSFALLENDCQILMGYLEELVMIRSVGNHLLDRMYKILECLYDSDIMDEDDMLKWYESEHQGFRIVTDNDAMVIREKAKPFIEWLRAAEEDESDGDHD